MSDDSFDSKLLLADMTEHEFGGFGLSGIHKYITILRVRILDLLDFPRKAVHLL
jgi:hypothetical protein